LYNYYRKPNFHSEKHEKDNIVINNAKMLQDNINLYVSLWSIQNGYLKSVKIRINNYVGHKVEYEKKLLNLSQCGRVIIIRLKCHLSLSMNKMFFLISVDHIDV